ncbi:MAG: tetraacyldisaccharide 4'-kinase [Bacteroidota bacterium]
MLTRPWLWPLSPLYGLATDLRNWAYDQGWRSVYASSLPTLAIGNLSTGGTGKTPLAEWVLRQAGEQGLTAGYLSRGYKRQSQGFRWVEPKTQGYQTYGDEAWQVASKFPDLPVAVCADRRLGLQTFEQAGRAQFMVLDDVFQHRKVARDLNWVVVDAQRLPTRDYLLPAGNLRERRKHLRRADLLLINRVDKAEEIAALQKELAHFERPMAFLRPRFTSPRQLGKLQVVDWAALRQASLFLFAGIGNPRAFADQVRAKGLKVVGEQFFPDHHPFSDSDIDRLFTRAQSLEATGLLCTEKDSVRLYPSLKRLAERTIPVYHLPIELEWLAGEQIARDQLAQLLSELAGNEGASS